jgi:murein DD-endopeptidase MepM/ murein hydrolase activator NlpD
MSVRLPVHFKSTHPTGGLKDYPAIDVFGNPRGGDEVVAQFYGKVRKKSGRSPASGGSPGGSYGWSIYVQSMNGDDRYLTHFGTLRVKVGDAVKPGTVLGTVCDSAVSGKPNTSHIHYGLKKAKKPIPKPPERLLDVFGPKGNYVKKKQTSKQVAKAMPAWIKRFGFVTVATSGLKPKHPKAS